MNKRGISLAEMLAVVFIMGLISSVAVPLLTKVITNVEKKIFVIEAVSLADAVKTYCADNIDAIFFVEDVVLCGEGEVQVDNFYDYFSKDLHLVAEELIVRYENEKIVKIYMKKGRYKIGTKENLVDPILYLG